MDTATQIATSTLEPGANRALAQALVSKLQNITPPAVRSATDKDALRVRHLVAAHRAEAMRSADRARWSQHNADASWYAGKLRTARQFDAQAAHERELASRLTAEADALSLRRSATGRAHGSARDLSSSASFGMVRRQYI